jgi:hypothetical protein
MTRTLVRPTHPAVRPDGVHGLRTIRNREGVEQFGSPLGLWIG